MNLLQCRTLNNPKPTEERLIMKIAAPGTITNVVEIYPRPVSQIFCQQVGTIESGAIQC